MSKKNGLDPLLVYSVMRHESSFNTKAESEVGASGLMQVMPDHFTRLAKKDKKGKYEKGAYYSKMFNSYRVKTGDYYKRFDAYVSVTYGTGILADSLRKAGGNVTVALSLYNSGKKYGYLRFEQTIRYVAHIVPYYNKLKGA
jgi:soluble lytic murein transglycosylase-like protein